MKDTALHLTLPGILPLLLLTLFSCRPAAENGNVDYQDEHNWYTASCPLDTTLADVFYILPTCVHDWTDATGHFRHHADTDNEMQRGKMKPSYRLAEEIFADSCNFFSPYYRQITLESWTEDEEIIDRRMELAMEDILAAFSHFQEHLNGGRPYILAGFSQGAKCVVELLKTLDEEQASRLVAAYVIGYSVSDKDMESRNIVPARRADDTGVTVCYSSVTRTDALNPALSFSECCINPVNWRTDDYPAMLNDSVSVRVDQRNKVLLLNGLDESVYYVPALDGMFKPGNLHLQELLFYRDHLQQNVKERIRAFKQD